MILATVDVGSNTAKLLVADGDVSAWTFEPLYEERRHVRLGEGVDASGAINSAALGRLLEALEAFDQTARELGADGLRIGATSASRDATNIADIQAAVHERIGAEYAVIAGVDEARLSLLGALSALPHITGPAVVIDIGGGSTEFAGARSRPAELSVCVSLNVGSVRLTERCFPSQPPPAQSVQTARDLIRTAISEAELPDLTGYTLVGAAGTTGALARLHAGFDRWADAPADPIHLTRDEVREWTDRLAALTYAETLALNPNIMASRADIIAAGVLILDTAMDTLGFDALTISPRGLRHGLMLDLVAQGHTSA